VSGWAIDGQLGQGNVFKPTKSVFRDGFVAMFDATDGTRTATTYLSAEQPNEGADIDPLCMRLAGGTLFVGGSLNGDALYLQNAFHPGFSGGRTAFVMRLQVTAPDGLDLAWSSYLPGGSSWDEAYAIAADDAGGVYVAGASESTVPGFPTGGWQADNAGNRDAVVFRIDDSGAMPVLDAGTYLGGTKYDEALALSLAPSGAVWIAGRTQSSNFPTTLGAWDVSLSGKSDGFVARFDATLSTLEMASYFGGNRDDHCQALVFHDGVAYLAGETRSTDLPTVGALPGGSSNSGREDAFIARVDANGQPLHLTYLGGNRTDNAVGGLELDAQDPVVVGGQADSTNFPITSPTSYGGTNYVAVVSLN